MVQDKSNRTRSHRNAALVAGVIFVLAMLLFAAAPARAQQPAAPPPLAPETPPPEDEDDNTILLVLGGGAAVLLIGGGLLFLFMRKKRIKEEMLEELAVTPEYGVLFRDYRFQSHLNTGATSQVWEVVEVLSNRHFAMKILTPEKARDPALRQALYHEAEVGQEMAHQNIVRIFKIDRNKFNPNFVMEYFPSGSLKLKIMHKQQDWIRQHVDEILRQTATALAFMNAQGWVHRDIKPENILVNAAGEVRLIDFALALKIPRGWRFRKPPCQGTRSYMSPEQILCKRFDGRCDVYSFGATAYEIVTGRPPFRGADSKDLLLRHLTEKAVSPQVLNPLVTREFADLVLRCLAKKPEDRPRDFHHVLMSLRNMTVFGTPTAPRSPGRAGADPKGR